MSSNQSASINQAASIGRIVIYHPSANDSLGPNPLPAIVVKANSDPLRSVDIHVLGPFQGAIAYKTAVPNGIIPGGWTWPIKVMETLSVHVPAAGASIPDATGDSGA